ncbi:YcnI family protein [Actinomadura miaoliensis]|uniref:YcnI family protein n=1 Tax=Actinomadura miaoliensis TaxID=430685 RepID=A0ABP7X5I8_9ACTN
MSVRTFRHAWRAAAVGGLAAVSVAALATAASAHVTANPQSAEQGSFTKVSFRVPNERDNASTTEVRVDLPTDRPIAHVSVRPAPGWKVTVDKTKLSTPVKIEGGELSEVVSRITWTGGKIDPGQFEEFDVSMGPLPTGVDRVLFKAEQKYSNGEVVTWDQDPGTGADEPEHPAPELKLTPKAATAQATDTVTAKVASDDADSASDGTARLLGGLGLAAGVIGVGVGGFGLARGRSRS